MLPNSKYFHLAIRDYETFLSKKYPQKAVLKLVGDLYQLSGIERAMLYRGVTPVGIATRRKNKLVDEAQLKNEILYVDAYNQLLTIGSYLNGKPVFLSLDGVLRDAQEIHGKGKESQLPLRAVEIVISYLIKMEAAGLKLIFDRQVTGFDAFIARLNASCHDFLLWPEIIMSGNVDKDLTGISAGLIATSDSVIIDRSELKIFDLARATIEYHFWPKFIDLQTFI